VAYRVAYGLKNGPIPAVLSVPVVRLGQMGGFQVRRKVRLETPPPVNRARIVPVSVGVVYGVRPGPRRSRLIDRRNNPLCHLSAREFVLKVHPWHRRGL